MCIRDSLNHVPCLVVRAISDKADGSAEVDYPAFEKLAIEHSMKPVSYTHLMRTEMRFWQN